LNFSFKNRIAFYYLSATALITAFIFITIYLVVLKTVYNHLNDDLNSELNELSSSIVVSNNNEIIFANPFEWLEGEHKQIEVNPVFVQVSDKNGKTLKKTSNLLQDSLEIISSEDQKFFRNTYLSKSPVYQVQLPIKNNQNKIVGYSLVAMPLEESEIVLLNLRKTLIISYPIILIILFLVTRYIAGKSIRPINDVIATANRITRENLNERIPLPESKDEIRLLIETINELLNRLEDNLLREKQFTSDASHELRTPLSVIKGTLEVLIRKPREIPQYEEKIKYCIDETDRITRLINELLLLARYDTGKVLPEKMDVDVRKLILNINERLNPLLTNKNIKIIVNECDDTVVKADQAMMEIILDNIINNSIKYSDADKTIEISLNSTNENITCKIKDQGYGMRPEQIKKIFDRFYRNDDSRNSEIGGFGLGLSIVKKLCDLQGIELNVESELGFGTSFTLLINKH
jgi:signal transduction histidine kinase